jgi:hypothetical protein
MDINCTPSGQDVVATHSYSARRREMSRKSQVGNGIRKQSARPIEIHVDSNGEYWICDKGAEVSNFDFRGAGCAPHSEVHLVK